MNALMRI